MKTPKSPLDSFPSFVRHLVMLVWGYVMVVFGLLAMLEYPHRFQPITSSGQSVMIAFGVVAFCLGQFVTAVVARILFPAAHPKVAGAFELLPWAGLLAAICLGVVIWIIRA